MPLEINENDERFYRRAAQSYTDYVGDTTRRFTLNECGNDSLREYSIERFRERRESERYGRKKRALEYVRTRASKQPQQ